MREVLQSQETEISSLREELSKYQDGAKVSIKCLSAGVTKDKLVTLIGTTQTPSQAQMEAWS